MTYDLTVLVDDTTCAKNDCNIVKQWVSDISDIINFTFISKSDPNWEIEYKYANIIYNAESKIYIPLNPTYAYIYHVVENESNVDGLSYIDHLGGLAIVVHDKDKPNMLRLRFRHELLHWLGYPADAMSYYYFARAPAIWDTVMYALFGCKPFKNQEGNASKSIVMNYQDRYYNICYDLCRNGTPANWNNDDVPGWLKR